ncbi:MAG: NAD-dependent epimerase/dehydratase family protein [Thermodesulfovibrionales bacterium]
MSGLQRAGAKGKARSKPLHRGSAYATPTAAGGSPVIGLAECFRPGEYDRVERVLSSLRALRVCELRTEVSWAECSTPGGLEWFDWLIPRLAQEASLLPCFLATPPSLGAAPRTSSPPREPGAYADFLGKALDRWGEHFRSVELWSEPNNPACWDRRLDPEWRIFCAMLQSAASLARKRGKRTVLAGMRPFDPQWFRLICGQGLMASIDVVGVRGFSGMGEVEGSEWAAVIPELRGELKRHSLKREIWITGVGHSTWRLDELGQVREFVRAAETPVERVYWSTVCDQPDTASAAEEAPGDELKRHLGIRKADGTPKLLYRLWENGGVEAARELLNMNSHPLRKQNFRQKPSLILGGAGFIGTNLAHRLLQSGKPVLVYDTLSRPGVERNLRWLRATHGNRVQVEIADVCDRRALRPAVRCADQVYHLAAQVAVTTSLVQPLHDFTVNACGTVTLLEELRALDAPPPLLFTSTNKVYGGLGGMELVVQGKRYAPADPSIRLTGIGEGCPLDFHSPYGCSKGAADQYVVDYARTFGLPAAVFRMSCIYGPHQYGTEDQGWVAYFLISALEGRPLTIFGDGMQVRDVLFVDDLVDAFLLAQEGMQRIAGQAFNIGGGPANTLSLLELLSFIGELHRGKPQTLFDAWRAGDQKYYVSDSEKFRNVTGWEPRVGVEQGVRKLYEWLRMARGIPLPLREPDKEPHEVCAD